MSQQKMYRAFGFLVAANTEAVLLLAGAVTSATWLEAHYPMRFRWLPVTLVVALVIIVHSWVRIFKALVSKEKTPEMPPPSVPQAPKNDEPKL